LQGQSPTFGTLVWRVNGGFNSVNHHYRKYPGGPTMSVCGITNLPIYKETQQNHQYHGVVVEAHQEALEISSYPIQDWKIFPKTALPFLAILGFTKLYDEVEDNMKWSSFTVLVSLSHCLCQQPSIQVR
jgi:hypothetical protein